MFADIVMASFTEKNSNKNGDNISSDVVHWDEIPGHRWRWTACCSWLAVHVLSMACVFMACEFMALFMACLTLIERLFLLNAL